MTNGRLHPLTLLLWALLALWLLPAYSVAKDIDASPSLNVKEELQLAIHLEAARLTGCKVPANVLEIASTVFHRIESPPESSED